MAKRTILFPSLRAIALFAKQTNDNILVNTCNLTVTGELPDDLVNTAVNEYNATLLVDNSGAYSYDPVLLATASL